MLTLRPWYYTLSNTVLVRSTRFPPVWRTQPEHRSLRSFTAQYCDNTSWFELLRYFIFLHLYFTFFFYLYFIDFLFSANVLKIRFQKMFFNTETVSQVENIRWFRKPCHRIFRTRNKIKLQSNRIAPINTYYNLPSKIKDLIYFLKFRLFFSCDLKSEMSNFQKKLEIFTHL